MTTPDTTPAAAMPTETTAAPETAPEAPAGFAEPAAPDAAPDLDPATVVPEPADLADDSDTPGAPEDESRLSKAQREAKNLRTRLRETETRAEADRSAVLELNRREAARLATGPGALADGADLWAHGIDPSTLLAEDGTVDPQLVHEAVLAVAASTPPGGGGEHHRRRVGPARAGRPFTTSSPTGTGPPPRKPPSARGSGPTTSTPPPGRSCSAPRKDLPHGV